MGGMVVGDLLQLTEGGVPMVTHSDLFQFVTMLVAFAGLIHQITKKH